MQIYKECLITLLSAKMFHIMLGFIAFDIILGTLVSFKKGIVSSRINKDGITKHLSIILFIIFFSVVFIISDMKEYFNILLGFYIASYGLSILENLSELGVPFPVWIKERFILLRRSTNEIKRVEERK